MYSSCAPIFSLDPWGARDVLPTPENGKVVFRFNPSFADVIETFRQSVIPPPERLVDESIDYGKVIMEFHYDDGTVVVMGRNFEVSDPQTASQDAESASSDSSDWRSSSDDSSSSSSDDSDWRSLSNDSDSTSSSDSSDWRSSSDDSESQTTAEDSYSSSSSEAGFSGTSSDEDKPEFD
jgi:hypothetical protein